MERRKEVLTISITGPPGAEEERGARTLFNASLCFLYWRVRFLVAIGKKNQGGGFIRENWEIFWDEKNERGKGLNLKMVKALNWIYLFIIIYKKKISPQEAEANIASKYWRYFPQSRTPGPTANLMLCYPEDSSATTSSFWASVSVGHVLYLGLLLHPSVQFFLLTTWSVISNGLPIMYKILYWFSDLKKNIFYFDF